MSTPRRRSLFRFLRPALALSALIVASTGMRSPDSLAGARGTTPTSIHAGPFASAQILSQPQPRLVTASYMPSVQGGYVWNPPYGWTWVGIIYKGSPQWNGGVIIVGRYETVFVPAVAERYWSAARINAVIQGYPTLTAGLGL